MSEEKLNIGTNEGDQVIELDINRLKSFKMHHSQVSRHVF